MNVASLIHSDLRNEDCSGAETKDAELTGVSCLSECSKSDQAGTQQRRGLNVTVLVRNGNAKTLISNGEFGITAVPCVTRELRGITEILLARSAVFTAAAGPCKPGNTHSLTGFEPFGVGSGSCNTSNDLVSWYQRKFWIRQISVHCMKIRSAYGACVDADQYVAGAWLRYRQLRFAQRISRSKQNHRPHVLMITTSRPYEIYEWLIVRGHSPRTGR